ncbi:MAG: hypothetical protein WA783_17405 [Phormidesmis sp.]
MEKYLLSESVPIPKKIRRPWFLLGCGCLLAGGVYLSFVDLGGEAIAPARDGSLAVVEAAQ